MDARLTFTPKNQHNIITTREGLLTLIDECKLYDDCENPISQDIAYSTDDKINSSNTSSSDTGELIKIMMSGFKSC